MNQKLLHFLQKLCVFEKDLRSRKKNWTRRHKQSIHYFLPSCVCVSASVVAAVYTGSFVNHWWSPQGRYVCLIHFDFVPIFMSLKILNDSIGLASDDDGRPPPSSSHTCIYMLRTSPYIGHLTNEIKLHHKKGSTLICWLFQRCAHGQCVFCVACVQWTFIFRLPTINNLIMEQPPVIIISIIWREEKDRQTHKIIYVSKLPKIYWLFRTK